MKPTYTTEHLSSAEMTRLIENKAGHGASDHAHLHLQQCSLCREALEGLKALPDLKALNVLNAKWKIKSGIKPSPRKLIINLPALYTMLTLIGLLSITVVYFFFFNPKTKQHQKQGLQPNTVTPTTELKQEHFIITTISDTENVVMQNENSIDKNRNKGVYDQLADPALSIEKIEPLKPAEQIPEVILDVVKGNSNEALLNMEGFKIIDYSNQYAKDELTMQQFNKGLSARYETLKDEQKDLDELETNRQTVSYEGVMAQGLNDYKKGKYQAALGNFNFILGFFNADKNALFYSSLCYKAAGNTESAIKMLSLLASDNNHTFYQEAKWHLALCYRIAGETEKAQLLLKEIVNEKGFYTKQATNLLSDSSE